MNEKKTLTEMKQAVPQSFLTAQSQPFHEVFFAWKHGPPHQWLSVSFLFPPRTDQSLTSFQTSDSAPLPSLQLERLQFPSQTSHHDCSSNISGVEMVPNLLPSSFLTWSLGRSFGFQAFSVKTFK